MAGQVEASGELLNGAEHFAVFGDANLAGSIMVR
jgi:hypothetical protein